MSLTAIAVPSADRAPEHAQPSPVAAILAKQAARRAVLRGTVGAGMAVALTVLGLATTGRKAQAGWWSTYSTWLGCANHAYGGACIAGYVSSINCNGAGYHRDDSGTDGCFTYNWDVYLTTCLNMGVGRNAWEWYYDGSGSNSFRCSDGHYYENDCGLIWSTSSACLKWL